MTPELQEWNATVEAKRREQLAGRKSTLARPVRTPRNPSRHPFKALLELRKAVDEARQKFVFGTLEYQVEIAKLPPYKGRGKGGHHRVKNRVIGGHWYQDRSKYSPHQGKSERARRVFQAAPAWIREETRRVEELI